MMLHKAKEEELRVKLNECKEEMEMQEKNDDEELKNLLKKEKE